MQLALGEERLSFHLESCHSYPCQVSQDVLPSPLAHSGCSHTHSSYMCRASWSCDYSCFKPQESIVSYLPTPSLCNSQPSVYGESPHLHQTFQVSPAIGVFLDTQFPPSQHVPAFSCPQLQGLQTFVGAEEHAGSSCTSGGLIHTLNRHEQARHPHPAYACRRLRAPHPWGSGRVVLLKG